MQAYDNYEPYFTEQEIYSALPADKADYILKIPAGYKRDIGFSRMLKPGLRKYNSEDLYENEDLRHKISGKFKLWAQSTFDGLMKYRDHIDDYYDKFNKIRMQKNDAEEDDELMLDEFRQEKEKLEFPRTPPIVITFARNAALILDEIQNRHRVLESLPPGYFPRVNKDTVDYLRNLAFECDRAGGNVQLSKIEMDNIADFYTMFIHVFHDEHRYFQISNEEGAAMSDVPQLHVLLQSEPDSHMKLEVLTWIYRYTNACAKMENHKIMELIEEIKNKIRPVIRKWDDLLNDAIEAGRDTIFHNSKIGETPLLFKIQTYSFAAFTLPFLNGDASPNLSSVEFDKQISKEFNELLTSWKYEIKSESLAAAVNLIKPYTQHVQKELAKHPELLAELHPLARATNECYSEAEYMGEISNEVFDMQNMSEHQQKFVDKVQGFQYMEMEKSKRALTTEFQLQQKAK